PRAVEPPERGAEAGGRALVRGVDPQRPGDVRALERVLVERHEREQPLLAQREGDHLSGAAELEWIRGRQRDRSMRGPRRRELLRIGDDAHRVAPQPSARDGDRRYEMEEAKPAVLSGTLRT